MKKLILLIVWMCAALAAHAQLEVASECVESQGDITAFRLNDLEPIVVDGDTIPFALVKVGLAEPDVVFDSKWALKQEFKDNEYWVYLMDGIKSITIKSKRFAPLHYRFPEPLSARSTYIMTIHKPQNDRTNGKMTVTSNVPAAKVYVDGSKVSDGVPFTYVGESGPHTLELRADGYDSQSRSVNVPMGQEISVNVPLYLAGSFSYEGIGYGFIPVEAATFVMGGPLTYYTRPAHQVSTRPLNVGSTLVSADLWEKVMGSIEPRQKGPNGQVVNVSYSEVEDFISTLNSQTGSSFRLPTEAEWEYMAKNAQKLGISDIGTGCLEWCSDWFGQYQPNTEVCPQGPDEGVMKVVRGGAEYADDDPNYSNPIFRWRKLPDQASEKISFRLVYD